MPCCWLSEAPSVPALSFQCLCCAGLMLPVRMALGVRPRSTCKTCQSHARGAHMMIIIAARRSESVTQHTPQTMHQTYTQMMPSCFNAAWDAECD